MAKVVRQRHARHFGECASHLYANGARTDECEGQLAANFHSASVFDGRHFFRSLECAENFAADEVGIIERFEAWREVAPFVVAKIVVLDTRREDEKVVLQVTSCEMDDALV